MIEKNFIFNDGLGEEIFVYIWSPDYFNFDKINFLDSSDPAFEKIKGIFQISHGMAEHAKRYEDFAKFLTDNGYIVFANDHRGHFKTAKTEDKQGIFNIEDVEVLKKNFNFEKFINSVEKTFNLNFENKLNSIVERNDISLFLNEINNGWDLVLFDMLLLNIIIKSLFKEKKVFLFGHSMGSMLSRNYISKYNEYYIKLYDKVILSGTSGDPGILGQVGYLITKLIILFNGKNKRSPFLNKLSFGKFNDNFKPNRTEFDWLSRDEKIVDKYVDDEWCGFIAKAGFFQDLLKGIFEINKIDNIFKINKDLKVLLISGNSDPVGDNGKGVKQVYDKFKKCGIKSVELKLYENARHEILNEINKEEVYKDILNWVES